MFLIDTDHLGIIQGRTDPQYGRLRTRMGAHARASFYVSIVSFHEQALGWNAYIGQSKNATGVVRGYRMFERILADFARSQVLPFDDVAAALFDSFRKNRVRVPTMDLRIASTALAHDLTILTRNSIDFAKVPGLRHEDWTT
jgi:tRNA(fMet)-specific endonuclease VapC